MQNADEYRARAEECLQLAEKAPTAEIRESYFELAQTWFKLAGERVELIISAKVAGA